MASNDLRREPSERSAPDRYRIGLLLRPSELGLAPPTALCDSELYRLVMEADSQVLDVGRSTPIWPPGIRRGITARDRGCVFPGCDRPPSWCDIHHCKPWSEGGDTAANNGALLCRAHHTFIHRHDWKVVLDSATGTPEIYRPDGTIFSLQRHPPPGSAQLRSGAQKARLLGIDDDANGEDPAGRRLEGDGHPGVVRRSDNDGGIAIEHRLSNGHTGRNPLDQVEQQAGHAGAVTTRMSSRPVVPTAIAGKDDRPTTSAIVAMAEVAPARVSWE